MMKTWLIRRSVLSPVSRRATSASSSSVCRLPFISELGLARADQLDRLGRGRVAVRHVDDLDAADVDPQLLRDALGSSAPDRPGSARSFRPRRPRARPSSEVSSQGCATAVGTAGMLARRRDQPIVLLVSARCTACRITAHRALSGQSSSEKSLLRRFATTSGTCRRCRASRLDSR